MDSLLDSFSSAFAVTSDPNDTAAPHPRIGQYKEKPINVPDQATRRQRMLEQQKKKRHDYLNYSRKLAAGDLTEADLKNENENEDMEFLDYREKRKKFNPYAYQLMLSEWLVDVPEDLENDWLMVICPHGRRNLIIASNCTTSAYTKSGFRVNRFQSRLPGGSPKTSKPGEYSILDCIFNEVSNTFYVLDIMCWRGHPVFDSETEFRFYWLQTKIQEEQDVSATSPLNHYKFVQLNSTICRPESIRSAVEAPATFEVDGLLFYHKRSHYVQGRTPLVGWLKIYMLPEILGITINDNLLAQAPRVNKMTLLNNNKELQNTTDDKTAAERVVAEEKSAKNSAESCDQMEVEKTKHKGRKKKGSRDTVVQADLSETELLDCSGGDSSPMEVTSKSRRKRRGKKKKGEKMDGIEEIKE